MESELRKVRKLKLFEVYLEVAQNEFQCTIPCYWMTLESRKELSEEQIEETLRILSRNTDILRLCIRKENDDEYWFYEMDEEKIELEILKNQSPEKVFSSETRTSFDSAAGPLWRTKYIKNDETLKEGSTFSSNIMLTFNHAIVDGFTCLHICNNFLKVLNDVISEQVQNSYDFGQLNDDQETEELTEKRLEYLQKNPDRFTEVKAFHNKFDSQKVDFKAFFPILEDVEKKSKFIHGEIDEEHTKKLLKVFKSKGISFHAGFSSAINWVLMELFTENGLPDEEIDLPSEHPINMRRYWKKSSKVQLGSHAAALKLLPKTDKNVGSNFWKHARDFNSLLKNAIESMQGIDANVTLTTSDFGKSDVNFSKMIENHPPSKSYYCVTNLGNLTSILQGRGEHVSIKWITRGASVHCLNNCIVLFIQTYEGRFLYSVAYSTHLVRSDIANLIVNRLMDKLKLLCNL